MDPLVSVLLPLALWALAAALARREWRAYRRPDDIGTDLFVYSRGRLIRRMLGVGLLVALGATLAALGWLPARSPRGLSIYMALLAVELAGLIVVPLLDLWETARTARPHDLTRQGGPPPRRKGQARPRR